MIYLLTSAFSGLHLCDSGLQVTVYVPGEDNSTVKKTGVEVKSSRLTFDEWLPD